jgi:hypothetical protein
MSADSAPVNDGGHFRAPPPPSLADVFPRTASADFHVNAFKERPHSKGVWLDVEENCVRFLVMKKLNMMKTSKRMLVLDFNKKEIRNETVRVDGQTALQGEVLRKFPFREVKQFVDGLHHDHEDEVSRLSPLFTTYPDNVMDIAD